MRANQRLGGSDAITDCRHVGSGGREKSGQLAVGIAWSAASILDTNPAAGVVDDVLSHLFHERADREEAAELSYTAPGSRFVQSPAAMVVVH